MMLFLSSVFVTYLDLLEGGLMLVFEAFWESHLVLMKSL